MSERREPTSFNVWLFRGGFTAVLAAYYGIFFVAARALQGHVGFDWRWSLGALAATTVMTLFVIPLAVASRLPENWSRDYLPAIRWKRGLCPECGYRLGEDVPEVETATPHTAPAPSIARHCPECGAVPQARPIRDLASASLRTFAWMALVGLLVGGAAGEAFVQIDEWRFRAEVERAIPGGATRMERRREWPGSFARISWSPERGFEAQQFGTGAK